MEKHEIPTRSPVLDAYVRVQKKKQQGPLRSNIEIPRFTLFKFCFVWFLFGFFKGAEMKGLGDRDLLQKSFIQERVWQSRLPQRALIDFRVADRDGHPTLCSSTSLRLYKQCSHWESAR